MLFPAGLGLLSWFQFHKVRLKANTSDAVVIITVRFQFHKVRLKAVSVLLVRLKTVVSIPQGTIKRTSCHALTNVLGSFQFHKVRLKDSLSKRLFNSFIFVSIPQGTIKS